MEHEEEQEEKKIRGGACEFPYFERNNYYHGKFMTVRDFFAEQCYFNQKRWLINRMVNGWGVVCGLDVKKHPENEMCVIVTPGLAIDCLGREILVCEKQNVYLKPEEPECPKEETNPDETLVICLEYEECKTEATSLHSQGNCDLKERCEFNRIRDSFCICVRRKADVCIDDSYERICPLDSVKSSKIETYRTFHEIMHEDLKAGCFGCPYCSEMNEKLCLVLAEIPVEKGEPEINKIDTSKRKLVYRNPLLYDLTDCFHGDLPHVFKINWQHGKEWKNWVQRENESVKVRPLHLSFDLLMDKKTINENTLLLITEIMDEATGNYRYERVPGKITYDPMKSVASFEVEPEWINDTYRGHSRIRMEGGKFIVILKGDFMLSDMGGGKRVRALDGNFIRGKLPSGNGTEGSDFFSWFTVPPKP
ncbi:hypothetical protein ACSAZK_03665 [Methanosarcina sp. Mfa9]|uniref:hypothetical protein n=1 Tax=Methanosarcina sp. Mfa9 TaxID=3439063 RepID=UPI003F878322